MAYNNQTLVSRMSKLNTEGLNSLKFNRFQIDNNKSNNSNEYFKNYGISISGKKQIKKMKLKDQNINQKLTKEQNITISKKFKTNKRLLKGFEEFVSFF